MDKKYAVRLLYIVAALILISVTCAVWKYVRLLDDRSDDDEYSVLMTIAKRLVKREIKERRESKVDDSMAMGPMNIFPDYKLYDTLEDQYYEQLRKELNDQVAASQNMTEEYEEGVKSEHTTSFQTWKVIGIVIACLLFIPVFMCCTCRLFLCCCPWCDLIAFRNRVHDITEEWAPGVYTHHGQIYRYPPTKEEIDALNELKDALKGMMRP